MGNLEDLDGIEVISFDVFDTLLKRNCSSSAAVFELVERQYNNNQRNRKLTNFQKKRIQAELDSYKTNPNPTIDEIYECLNIDDSIKSELKRIEIETEYRLAIINPEIVDTFKYAKNSGRKIIAISDMYLSSTQIKKELDKIGVGVDEVFVSCEEGCNKSSGKLFTQVCKKIDVDRNKIIHIGDNKSADVKGAKKAGIKGVLVTNSNKKLAYQKLNDAKDKNIYPFIYNHVNNMDNPIEKLGFEVMGPVIMGFCQLIHKCVKKSKYNKILFCARDAQQTYELYTKMYPEDKEICSYIYVSLSSLEKPFLAASGKTDDKDAFSQLKLCKDYLRQNGADGKVAIVDSGFGGHTELMLKTILSGQAEVHGIYMRTSKEFPKVVDDPEAQSFLYENHSKTLAKISGGFFETLVSGVHGRTLKYVQGKNNVLPLLGEENPYPKTIQDFQVGIEKFCRCWEENFGLENCIDGRDVEKAFLRFAFYPKKNDVITMSGIKSGNEKYVDIVEKPSKGIGNYLRTLQSTYWKGGYFATTIRPSKTICTLYLILDVVLQKILGY